MQDSRNHLWWHLLDDKEVVTEMLEDPCSEHWQQCYRHVKVRVQISAKRIPQDDWDDIVQVAMMRITKSLPSFRYGCSFKTWLYGIIVHSIVDAHRKNVANQRGGFLYDVSLDKREENITQENATFIIPRLQTVEDECLVRDDLTRAVELLQEYASSHAKSERNKLILRLVLFENRPLKEAASDAGCTTAVAGHVVRSAQQYVRTQLASE